MSKVAKDINGGKCLFCSSTLYYCDEDGDIDYPGNEDWVTCDNNDCMRGAIATQQYEAPDQCYDSESCPHYDEWHDSDCDDCDRQDCDDCDKQDCDDCDRGDCTDCDWTSPDDMSEKMDSIKTDLAVAITSFREENGRFIQNEADDIRKAVQEVITNIEEDNY